MFKADETTVVVFDYKDKDKKAKKYMWLYKTGELKDPVILYDYQKTRSSTYPKEFLKDFSGILQSDGYAGYNYVENDKRLYCLSHIRRKYFEIISKLKGEVLKESRAAIGFDFCEKLYKIEKDLREEYQCDDDYYDKRYTKRLEKSSPIIEESKNLLKDGRHSILKVSMEVGFENQSYFSKVFKKLTGVTPKEYKVDQKNFKVAIHFVLPV